MDGHIDAVSCMAKNPIYLKGIFSGSMDGGTSLPLFLKPQFDFILMTIALFYRTVGIIDCVFLLNL